MYGTQTVVSCSCPLQVFENDVKMYGTQTVWQQILDKVEFENDVKMYGTQTHNCITDFYSCLRMM